MKFKSIFFVLVNLLVISVHSQNKFTISGYVEDLASGEKLMAANVYDLNTKNGTSTNEYGFFSITLPSDSIKLAVSFVGYTTYQYNFFLDKDINLNIKLDPVLQLAEVTITDRKADETVKNTQMSIIEMPVHQIKTLPVFMGEADVMKTLQLMPGVQSGSEGSSGLYVRGGGPDQNLILLDGVPVYNADHLFGFFSVFNPDALSSVKLIKGGYPARYGGRLSSVLDIRMKEGNIREYKGEFSIGTVASKFTVEGPIIKDKTSFIVSARRTYIDILTAPLIAAAERLAGGNGNLRAGYYFYDANVKLNHKFSDKDRLFISFYTGRDKAYMKNKEEYLFADTINVDKSDAGLLWGNLTTSIRWNHIFGNKIFANTTLVYSNYKFNTFEDYTSKRGDIEQSSFSYDYFSGISNYGAKIDFDYMPAPRHSIKFGANYLYHQFKPGVSTFKILEDSSSINQTFGNNSIYANEFYIYAEDDINIGSRLKANIGIHYSGFAVKDKYYNSLQPRIALRYLASENLSFKAAFTRMDQYIHLLTNSTIGLPTDLWLPTTENILPQNSYQTAIGGAYNINDNWEITLEGFYKTMDNLIEYKEGASFFDIGTNWESKVETGKGYSYGAELLIRKNIGKFTGWIGYTLSWSNRKFENLNNGEVFPYKYDRRHDIAIVILYEVSDNIDLGLTWVYGTGNALTLGVARYSDLPENYQLYDSYYYDYYGYGGWNEIEYYKSRNSYRTPAYHRLDVSANFHKQKTHGVRTWSVGLYNAYSRQNPFFIYFGYANNKKVLKQISLFPMIPSVRYSFKF